MTTGLTTPTGAAPKTPGTRHHRTARNAALGVGIAVLVAGGGYAATTTFGPDAYEPQPAPAASEIALPSGQAQSDLSESVAGQYGARAARPAGGSVRPGRQAQRELHEVAATLYGPRP